MSRSISPPTNYYVKDRFLSRSRSPKRLNGFNKYSKSRSMSRSPVRNRLIRRSPINRSPYSRSLRSFSRSPRRSSKRPIRKINRNYSRSTSLDYRGKPRRSSSRSRSPPKLRRKIHGDREHPTPSSCLGVFGLSKRTEERQLWEIFERYGHIKSIQLVMDKYTRTSQGFGFIYFENAEAATKAKVDGNGMEIDGKLVRIDYSITRKAHTPTPGVYLGKKSSRRRGDYDHRDVDERDRRESYGGRDYSDRRRPRSRSRTPYQRSSSRSYGNYPKRDR